MHEGLNEFLALARQNLRTDGNGLYFIIDQTRQPEALTQLYNCGHAIEVEYLLYATEFEHLAESGPIWVSVQGSHELTQLCARLCQERQAGIAIRAQSHQLALTHARRLLKINDGSGGQSLATYYQPALWAALAMTIQGQRDLFGPWSGVTSPALINLQKSQSGWLDWQPPSTVPRQSQPDLWHWPTTPRKPTALSAGCTGSTRSIKHSTPQARQRCPY